MRVVFLAAALTGALSLPGCATQLVEASRNECAAFGFAPGTVEYAGCVQQRFGQRQQALMRMSAAMQAAGQTSYAAPVAPTLYQPAPPTYSAGGVGILQGQRTVGMSKICSYNRLGSPYVITVGAADLCPLSPP